MSGIGAQSSDENQLILSDNLQEFFRSEVSGAASGLGVTLSDVLEYYVVNLLVDFSRPDIAAKAGNEPLAFIYKRALESEPHERVTRFKELGDLALYVAGFFEEFIERSLVDVGYYISMGGQAYSSLATSMGRFARGDGFCELYRELGERFGEMVDVLNEVSGRTRKCKDSDILRLYDRWLSTGSDRARRLLGEQGVIPVMAHDRGYMQ